MSPTARHGRVLFPLDHRPRPWFGCFIQGRGTSARDGSGYRGRGKSPSRGLLGPNSAAPGLFVVFSFPMLTSPGSLFFFFAFFTQVDVHNDILGEISEEMERADGRLARETRNMKVILVKSRTHWGLWLLIVLLLIAILVVSVVKT